MLSLPQGARRFQEAVAGLFVPQAFQEAVLALADGSFLESAIDDVHLIELLLSARRSGVQLVAVSEGQEFCGSRAPVQTRGGLYP